MPPAAATAAARRTTAEPVEPDSFPEAYTKRAGQATHTTHAPRAPRRTASVAAPPRPAAPRPAPARPRTAPERPRTAPAPARRSHTVAPNPRPIRIERPAPRPLRVERPRPRVGLVLRLPRGGKLLDTVVRGRAWIPVLGVLLVGIVAMRVEVLKLGASVGNEIQQVSVLQSANAVMLKQDSALSDSNRIEHDAAKLGMVMPGPLDLHFVKPSSGNNVNRAIADITEPSPAVFLANLESEREKDGESAATAAMRSAIGVNGGGAITPGTSSGGSAGSTTTLTLTPTGTTNTAAADPAASATQTPTTNATGDTQAPVSTATDTSGATDPTATDPTDPASTDTAGATDPTSSDTPATTDPASAGTANDTPPVTSTETNGAASLAG